MSKESIQEQECILIVEIVLNTYRLVSISKNIEDAGWIKVQLKDNILGNNLLDLFDENLANSIISLIHKLNLDSSEHNISNYLNNQNDNNIDCFISCNLIKCFKKDVFIVELKNEPNVNNECRCHMNDILMYEAMIEKVNVAESVKTVTKSFCDTTMDLIPDYDRGMVYLFGDNNSFCDLVYENITKKSKNQQSYLNSRLQSHEIIPCGVELFKERNNVEMIYNINNIVGPMNSLQGEEVSVIQLRGLSIQYIEQLKNKGVVSSLVIPIIVNKTLWGLYTFHSHRKTVKPTMQQRILLRIAAKTSALKVASLLVNKEKDNKIEICRIMSKMSIHNNKLNEFLNAYGQDILNILKSDSIIIIDENKEIKVFGDFSNTLNSDDYKSLLNLCQVNHSNLLVLSDFSFDLNHKEGGVIFTKSQFVSIAVVRIIKSFDMTSLRQSVLIRGSDVIPSSTEKDNKFCLKWTESDQEVFEIFSNQIITTIKVEKDKSIYETKLEQASIKYEQAVSSMKEHYEFFAHMSHELRTPFHGVISSLQILKGGCSMPKEERDEILDSALDCGDSMIRILNDILSISKSRNFKELNINSLSISSAVISTRRIMKPIAETKGINFTLSLGKLFLGDDLLTESSWKQLVLHGDETKITQLANNLTSNAIKFTPYGGSVTTRVQLLCKEKMWGNWNNIGQKYPDHHFLSIDATENIKLKYSASDNNTQIVWYTVEVEDTGCGLKYEDLKVMFDPYKQIGSASSKSYQGTGLGLYICRLHIELMSGMIGVASVIGQGTLFMFAIPLLYEKDNMPKINVEASLESEIDSISSSTSLTPKRKIPIEFLDDGKLLHSRSERNVQRNIFLMGMDAIFILVDDSQVNLRLTKRKLLTAFENKITDSNIKFASDGLEAIALYQSLIDTNLQKNVAIILMDNHMPNCSGPEAIIEIRKLESTNNLNAVHIVAFTADVTENSNADLISSGANVVLSKPTPEGELENICSKCFISF